MMNKKDNYALDGVVLLDKPFGLSSNTALQKVRRLYQAKKAGHTGNLDPYATGLLPICFGEATKFSQRWLEADKGYRATITFGAISNTGDKEGILTPTQQPLPSKVMVQQALLHFQGDLAQVPPMYSALKHQGKALYEYARRGEEILRPARTITIRQLSLHTQLDEDTFIVDVVCSKGTYIRVLAEDIGRYLGCGAYLSGLQRTLAGTFLLKEAYTIAQLEALDRSNLGKALLPIDQLVMGLDPLTLEKEQARALLQGKKVWLKEKSYQKAEYRLYVPSKAGDNTEFIGLGRIEAENYLYPSRMLAKAVAQFTSAA
jgi:tRNA pseudouridine55 synthase